MTSAKQLISKPGCQVPFKVRDAHMKPARCMFFLSLRLLQFWFSCFCVTLFNFAILVISCKKTRVISYLPFIGQETRIQLTPKQQKYIQAHEPEEVEVIFQFEFTAPKLLLYNPMVKIQIDDSVYEFVFVFTGDIQTIEQFMAEFLKQINELQYNNIDFDTRYDHKHLLQTGKIMMYNETNYDFTIQTDDVQLCKILGIDRNVQYKVQYQSLTTQLFSHKSYIQYAKTLNIKCFNIQQPTIFEQNEERFIIVKQNMTGIQPGQIANLSSSQEFIVSTYDLVTGIIIKFYDENYCEYKLEDPVKVVLNVNSSKRKAQEQIENEDNDFEREKMILF